MRLKTCLVALVLGTMPVAAFAACFGAGHEKTAMSCAEGTVYDAETGNCVATTG